MTRHIIEQIGPHLRALAEAIGDKAAGLVVQIGMAWASGQ